ASSYRTKEEVEAWMQEDSIVVYGKNLVAAGLASDDQLEKIKSETAGLLTNILRLSIDDNLSPRLDLQKDPDAIGKMMFSNCSLDRMEERTPETLLSLDENPRVKSIKNKERFYKDKDGKPVSKAKIYQLRDGI